MGDLRLFSPLICACLILLWVLEVLLLEGSRTGEVEEG